MTNCGICDSPIPRWMTIEGKRRNLQRRKFCLDCSPFQSGKRIRTSTNNVEGRKSRNNIAYRRRLKGRLIEHLGGHCTRCGYDKPCLGAYAFHHPGEKKFQISASYSKGWEALREEAEKCELVCVRCHAEIHDGAMV